MTPEEHEESRRKAVKLLGEDHVRSLEKQEALLNKEELFLQRWVWLIDIPVIGRFIYAWWKTQLDMRLRTVIPFQCNHCGETLYAPSEEEMEIMMEEHLHESHPEETRRELSPLESAFSEQSRAMDEEVSEVEQAIVLTVSLAFIAFAVWTTYNCPLNIH